MDLKIDLFCNDGSPMGLIPADIYGKGVGGAELALMSWAETMARRGHEIRIYNDPTVAGNHDEVKYLPKGHFNPMEDRDAFILFRNPITSPSPHLKVIKAGIKIHWSTDQYTSGDFGRDIFPFIDKVICISPYHVDYHKQRYGIENGKIDYIDLGVKLDDYDQQIEKIPGRCIFCSVPDRGLDILHQLWPKIKEQAPEASLVITSDYRLWGSPTPRNHQHRLKWLHQQDVIFLGKIDRAQLVQEQLMAEVHSFPCTYEELFCISAAECQVAGAYPITSGTGALSTTNQFGTIIHGNLMEPIWHNQFVSEIVRVLHGEINSNGMSEKARSRFDWNKICKQWEKLIETGEI